MLDRPQHDVEFRGSVPRSRRRQTQNSAGAVAAAALLVTVLIWGATDSSAVHVGEGRLRLEPAEVTFGQQAIATVSAPQVVRLSNAGTTAAQIGQIRLMPPDAFQLVPDGCSSGQIAAQGSCELQLRFAPNVTGSHLAVLDVLDPDGDRISVLVRGSTPPTSDRPVAREESDRTADRRRHQERNPPERPAAEFTPGQLLFGRVSLGTSRTARVLLRNTGKTVLRDLRLQLDGDSGFAATAVAGEAARPESVMCVELQPASSCSVTLTFEPGHEGQHRATLRARSAGSDMARVALLGIAERPRLPAAEVHPNPLELTKSERTGTVTVRNAGEAPLVLGRVSVSKPAEFTIAGSSCNPERPLLSGEMCWVEVKFSGKSTSDAVLDIEHNDERESAPRRILLMGAVPPGRKRAILGKAIGIGIIGAAIAGAAMAGRHDEKRPERVEPARPTQTPPRQTPQQPPIPKESAPILRD